MPSEGKVETKTEEAEPKRAKEPKARVKMTTNNRVNDEKLPLNHHRRTRTPLKEAVTIVEMKDIWPETAPGKFMRSPEAKEKKRKKILNRSTSRMNENQPVNPKMTTGIRIE